MKRILSQFTHASVIGCLLISMDAAASAQVNTIKVQDATASASDAIIIDVTTDAALSQVGAVDLNVRFDPEILKINGVIGSITGEVLTFSPEPGLLRTLQINPTGATVAADMPVLQLEVSVLPEAVSGTLAFIEIVDEADESFETFAATPVVPPSAQPFSSIPGMLFVESGQEVNTLTVTPQMVNAEVGETVAFSIEAELITGNIAFIEDLPAGTGRFLDIVQVGNTLQGTYEIEVTPDLLGASTITIAVEDDQSPPSRIEATIALQVTRPPYDEVILAQGFGGSTDLHIRNVAPNLAFPIIGIWRSFPAMPVEFEEIVGGGRERAVYVSTGDVDADGQEDLVTTFGPIVQEATFPSLFVVRNPRNKGLVASPWEAFPTNKPGESINYVTGEMRSAVGDFLGSGTPQIALAQGYGSNGIVRLWQINNTPGENPWKIVGQFAGLEDTGQHASFSNNLNGGVTLAAGDLTGDGVDELVAGQINGPSSAARFQVLSNFAANTNEAGVVIDASRIDHVALPFPFYGNGGIELAVADVNGDGDQDIIAASQGNARNFGDNRDQLPLGLISFLFPRVDNGQVTGFDRPAGFPIINVFPDVVNPSGAVSVAAGELNGDPSDGAELIVGTGSLREIVGFDITPVLAAPQSRYVLVKPNFTADGREITSITTLILDSNRGFQTFGGDFYPESGAIFVGVVESD